MKARNEAVVTHAACNAVFKEADAIVCSPRPRVALMVGPAQGAAIVCRAGPHVPKVVSIIENARFALALSCKI